MEKLILEKISWNDYQDKLKKQQLDSKTFYFIYDKGWLYIKDKIYSGKYELTDSDPLQPELNTVYINKNNLSMKIWDGLSYKIISKGCYNLKSSNTIKIIETDNSTAAHVVIDDNIENNIIKSNENGIYAIQKTDDNKLDKTGNSSDTMVVFSESQEKDNIFSGEKLSILFGKISKWLSSLKNIAFTSSYKDLIDIPATFPPSSHNHNDVYYTETEIDNKLINKSDTNHTHTKSEIIDFPISMPASDVYDWAKLKDKPTYTASEVGLGNVDNTSDKDKSVKYADNAGVANSINWDNVQNKPLTYNPSDFDASKIVSGTIDIERLPKGALERCIVVADDAARFKLTTSLVQVGDTVKVESTKTMYFVVDDTKLSSESGYEIYTAGSASSVPWSGVVDKPTTFPPLEHTHDDRYYTENEIDLKLIKKSDIDHIHSQYLTSHQDISGKIDNNATGANSLLSNITTTWTTLPTDDTCFIRQDTTGKDEFGRVKFSTLWSYIKEKTDKVYSVLGHKHTKTDITDFPTSLPANGGNASTVNGCTIESSVPANAKFTDTDTWRPLGTTADTACAGNDDRLSNARPASDVSDWAKQQTKPVYTYAEIEDREIDGVNLYQDTRSFKVAGTWANYTNWVKSSDKHNGFTVMERSEVWSGLYQTISVKKDEVYTLSFYAKIEAGGSIALIRNTSVFEYVSSTSEMKTGKYGYLCWVTENDNETVEFKRYSVTLKVLSDLSNTNLRIENYVSGKTLSVCGFKLEKGYIATEWTPNPVDIDNDLNNYLPRDGNAATATKLATARSINGASFDGTNDIQLPLYFSNRFGSTGNTIKYAVFCKMKKDNLYGEGETTMLLTAHGNFGGTIAGTYLVSISNRGGKVTMRVIALQQENSGQNTTEFGYYEDDYYFYCGVKRPSYSYSENITVFSKSSDFTVGIVLDTTTEPTGWTKVEIYKLAKTIDTVSKAYALDSSAGSTTQPIYFKDGKPVACTYGVNKTVPSDAVFTDTNTWRDVINNLTSTRTDASLSAAQGKVLKDMLDALGGQPEWTTVGTASSNINTYNGYYVRHGQMVVFAANFWGNGYTTQNARQIITGLPAPICWTALSTYTDAGEKSDSGAHEAYIDVDGSVYMKNLTGYKTFVSGCYICTA